MGWFFPLIVIAMLLAFNVFAADSMVRLKHDMRDLHKMVSAIARPVGAASHSSTAAAPSSPATAAAKKP